jgi:hypothetical protein
MEEIKKAVKDRLGFLQDDEYRYRISGDEKTADERAFKRLKLKQEAREIGVI